MASRSALLTVLFTDIVGSTEIAKEMGDRRWRELLARHHRIVRRELRRFGGREVDTAGDGFFAVFDRPEDAVRCAAAIADGVHELGIEIRAGVHAGQVELRGRDVGGVAVHVGARIGAAAGPGEVLVSGTLRDLLPGAVLSFEDRGAKDLKGIAEPQRVYAVSAVQGRPRVASLDEDEARRRRESLADAPSPRLSRRRWSVVAGVAIVALSGAVLMGVTLTSDDPAREVPVPGGTVGAAVVIDPETNQVEQTYGGLEGKVARFTLPEVEVGEGGVWILGRGGLRHLDPDSGEVTRIALETAAPTGMTIVAGRLWVCVIDANRVIEVSPGALEVSEVIRLREPTASLPSSRIAGTAEAVWAGTQDRLTRIDPSTRDVREFELSSSMDGLVATGGDLWVVDQLAGELTRVDGESGAPEQTVELVNLTPDEVVAAADGGLWILDKFAQSVTHVSSAGEVGRSIPVGEDPTGLVAGVDAVWVSHGEGQNVLRIDPDLGREVASIDVGGPAGAVGIDPQSGEIWVYLVTAEP